MNGQSAPFQADVGDVVGNDNIAETCQYGTACGMDHDITVDKFLDAMGRASGKLDHVLAVARESNNSSQYS